MADNEQLKRIHPPRRNPQQVRPPPGVQKAIQTFGVRDLREILDKKRQEQGESQGEKRPDPKLVNLPPPDPSYNYLKDPIRDKPKSPQKIPDHEKQYERPIARDRETSAQQHRYRDEKRSYRDREAFVKQENLQDSRDNRQQGNREYERPNARDREANVQQHRYGDEKRINRDRETVLKQQDNLQYSRDTRQQERRENNSNVQEKGVLKKNQPLPQSEDAPKKELRFSDAQFVEGQSQFAKDGRSSFRGRNVRRGGGVPRDMREGKIENPVNIKIELSTETGQRSCTLDENTKIPDIKHIPDKTPYQKSQRGGFRGGRGRGNFRSRGRGRGGFRGRGASSYRGRSTESRVDAQSYGGAFNMEKLQDSLPDRAEKNSLPAGENGNVQARNVQVAESNQKDAEENLEHYDEYDQENEEYNDANENYDDEFSNEYFSEYDNNSSEHAQDLNHSQLYETSQESEIYEHGAPDIIDPNLKATITITSSKFQDGEVKRSIEVVAKNNGEEKEIGATEQKKEK